MLSADLGIIPLTPANLAEAQRFAREEFEPPHSIPDNACADPNREFKLVTRDGILVGYFEVAKVPIVYPALSKRWRAKDSWELVMRMLGWSVQVYGDGYMGLPLQRPHFPEHMLRRLGFFRTKNELYKVIPR